MILTWLGLAAACLYGLSLQRSLTARVYCGLLIACIGVWTVVPCMLALHRLADYSRYVQVFTSVFVVTYVVCDSIRSSPQPNIKSRGRGMQRGGGGGGGAMPAGKDVVDDVDGRTNASVGNGNAKNAGATLMAATYAVSTTTKLGMLIASVCIGLVAVVTTWYMAAESFVGGGDHEGDPRIDADCMTKRTVVFAGLSGCVLAVSLLLTASCRGTGA
jgi:hypothetical protein